MISGNFYLDVNEYVNQNGGLPTASKNSEEKLHEIGIKPRSLDLGKMYFFRYLTPDEPKFDSSPIILFLGLNESRNIQGLNLHYIPYNFRKDLLTEIVESYTSIIEEELKKINAPNNQNPLDDFIWENVNNAFGDRYNLKHVIRQYRISRILEIKVIGYEYWYLGAVNNEDFFINTTINKEQSLYYEV